MNSWTLQKDFFTACDEMKTSCFSADRKEPVFCPKPRRVGLLSNGVNEPIRPLRCYPRHAEQSDSNAGKELLDIILMKGGGSTPSDQSIASSPPFFVDPLHPVLPIPVVQDARFGDEKNIPFSPLPIHTSSNLSPSGTRKGTGCVRTKFGLNPAAVRIEGFDCLDRDRRNCGITAVA